MEKVTCSLLLIGLLLVAGLIGLIGEKWSQAAQEPELRPIQKVMLKRAGWLAAITENMMNTNYEEVNRDATALASQARSMEAGINDPLFKKLTMQLATHAAALAGAAEMRDSATARDELALVKATCGECHARFNNN